MPSTEMSPDMFDWQHGGCEDFWWTNNDRGEFAAVWAVPEGFAASVTQSRRPGLRHVAAEQSAIQAWCEDRLRGVPTST